jgi:hypothetical protein
MLDLQFKNLGFLQAPPETTNILLALMALFSSDPTTPAPNVTAACCPGTCSMISTGVPGIGDVAPCSLGVNDGVTRTPRSCDMSRDKPEGASFRP